MKMNVKSGFSIAPQKPQNPNRQAEVSPGHIAPDPTKGFSGRKLQLYELTTGCAAWMAVAHGSAYTFLIFHFHFHFDFLFQRTSFKSMPLGRPSTTVLHFHQPSDIVVDFLVASCNRITYPPHTASPSQALARRRQVALFLSSGLRRKN